MISATQTHYQDDHRYRPQADPALAEMSIGQAFMDAIIPGAGLIWEAAEMGSGMYSDRHDMAQKRANGQDNQFTMGVKNSLGPDFSRARTRLETDEDMTPVPYWQQRPACGFDMHRTL